MTEISDEHLPEHKSEYCEVVYLKCPATRCSNEIEVRFDDLEPGTKHSCKSCGYVWKIAKYTE